MSTSMLAIFLVAALCSFLPLFFPSERIKDATKGALSVVLLLTVLTPLLSLGTDAPPWCPPEIPTLPEGESVVSATVREQMQSSVHSALCRRFSLASEDVSVTVSEVDLSMMTVHMRITLRAAAARVDHAAIAEYIEKEGWGTCDVYRELG